MLNKTVEALNKLLRLSRIRFDFVFLMLMQFLIEGQLVVLGLRGTWKPESPCSSWRGE